MARTRPLLLLAAGGGLALGLAVGAVLRVGTSESPSALPTGPGEELAALRLALEEGRRERLALADEVASLRFELETRSLLAARPDAIGGGPVSAAAHGDLPTPETESVRAPATAAAEQAAPRRRWFDGEVLAAQGLPDDEVEHLRAAFEASEMQQLYLRDQAVREGWFRTPRFKMARAVLRLQARTELGEDGYDWVLYATGRTNRVRLVDLLATSPAQEAGLQAGDLLVRYDDQPIYSAHDLRGATVKGKPGGTVAVDVVRQGEPVRLYVPRGPLGARLKGVRQPPNAG